MGSEGDAGAAISTVFVDDYTDGLLDPEARMLGPVRNGGFIVANTPSSCWGAMISPAIRGGHELTQPVAVEGADVGDAVAIHIKDVTVTSLAAASGVHRVIPGRDAGDPFILAKCPSCGAVCPETHIEGVGDDAIHCSHCGAESAPFRVEHGYTMIFDSGRRLGVTLSAAAARVVARRVHYYAALPHKSRAHPFLVMAPAHLQGVPVRLRPFLGQIGTLPAVKISGNYNAGDAACSLVNAPHDYGIRETDLTLLTDGHMDCDAVRPGTTLLCPVKVPGAGVYMGDMHAMQGDGEIAGHTADVSGIVTLQVEVVKGLQLEGPILLPLMEDLPFLARPFTADEVRQTHILAEEWGITEVEALAPVSFIGSGRTLNEATDCALERAAGVLKMSVAEVRNRATICGAIEIARAAGVVQATFLAPLRRLDEVGIGRFAREQYVIAG